MTIRSLPSLTVSFLIVGLLPAFADTQIIPQVADGANWSTTIVLANKTSTVQTVALSFNMDTANSATTPWTPPFAESISLSSISLAAGSTLFLHTPGTAATLTQGWGQIDAATGVAGYAIFTQRVPGTPAQDGTAPAVSASSRILVPFDNTSGLVSAFAVANPTSGAETVLANVRTSDGTFSGTAATLPAKGQTTFLLKDVFGSTAGKSGLAEFYVTSGSIAIIALRANGTAFTTAPAYFQTGAPIIGAPNTTQTSSPQTQVIPQVADGAGWATTIVLTNTTTGDLPVTLNFKQAVPNGAGVTTPWSPPFQTRSSSFNVPAGSSIFLRTPGNATDLSQGWAELVADSRVTGYAIFTQQSAGRAQDSTAPAVPASSRILVPFDNTSGLIMAIALVNPNPSPETVSVNFRTSDGTTSTNTVVPALPSQGQIAFLMRDSLYFPETAGKSGLAEFYVSSGTISIIALRANGSAITSAPVFFETGTPIITTGSGGGGGGTGGGGGGGGSTLPTQQEIDSWISRGSYTSGTINLGRSTISLTVDSIGATGSVTTTTTVTKGDGINAQFTRTSGADLGKLLRGELPPGYPNLAPAVGSCVVYDINALTNPYPNVTFVGLDAGSQITINGPNGTQAALRQSSQSSGFSYRATNVPNTYLAPGHYTFSGPGGADVGSLSGALDTVSDLVVTNPDELKVINRGSGVTVRWTGGDSSTVVTISGGSATVSPSGTTISGAAFACIQNTSAGSFTVPASILTQIPASAVSSIGGFNFVTRGSFGVAAAGQGARLPTPSGLDILTANNGWTWTFTPQYQ